MYLVGGAGGDGGYFLSCALAVAVCKVAGKDPACPSLPDSVA